MTNSGSKLRLLDGLRGLTALYVVLFHACGMLWTSVPIGSAGLPWLFENAVSFGHQAVLMFFVISGFCIHYRQAKSGARRINLTAFGWRRLRRLYPPLLLALALTAVLDHIGMRLNPGYYTVAVDFWNGPVTVGSSYSLRTLLGTLLFQADFRTPHLGSNSPLWSLSFEFWFYALYPVLLLIFARLGARRGTLAIFVLSTLCWVVLDGVTPWLRILSVWGVWALGALLAEVYVRGECPRLLRRVGPLAPVGLIAMALLSPIGPERDRFSDLWWAAVMAAGVGYAMLSDGSRFGRLFERICLACGRLGDISYSLYLTHYPVLALVAAWWLATRGSLPQGVELVAVGIVLSLAVGWLAWYAVERHCVANGRARNDNLPSGSSPRHVHPRSTANVGLGLAPGVRMVCHTHLGSITRDSVGATGVVLASGSSAVREHCASRAPVPGDSAGVTAAARLVAAP